MARVREKSRFRVSLPNKKSQFETKYRIAWRIGVVIVYLHLRSFMFYRVFLAPRLLSAAPDNTKREGEVRNEKPGTGLEDCRVLIVEDDFLLAMSLGKLLEREGCRIIGPTASVDHALAALQTERPDAAVIDINVNGETTATVAQQLAGNNVPYVIVTGYGPSELEAEVWRQAPLLQKPVRTAELVRVVSELLHPTPAERRASG